MLVGDNRTRFCFAKGYALLKQACSLIARDLPWLRSLVVVQRVLSSLHHPRIRTALRHSVMVLAPVFLVRAHHGIALRVLAEEGEPTFEVDTAK